jgi:gluconate 2-dehydrogenase gamma chain
MNRREVIRSLVLASLLGKSRLGLSVTQDPQLQLLRALADTFIPATDTPGAAQVGVAEIIVDVLQHWVSADTRASADEALEELQSYSQQKHVKSFSELDSGQRLTLLTEFNTKHMGKLAGFDLLKELIFSGYYLSEIGATQELRYELIPGQWRACISFSDIGRAYAI